MPDNIQITMLPAKEGDCLMITYGDDLEKKHILIDGGRAWTYKNALKQYLADKGITEIELIVITHVDRDHIDGMLKLIRDPELDLEVQNVWFNTLDHLYGRKIKTPEDDDDIEEFGAKMGEELSTEIIAKGWPWNSQFDGGAVELIEDPASNIIQMGDIKLTLLSPDREKLEALIGTWEDECEEAGMTPGSTVEDYVVDDDIEEFGGNDIEELAEEEFEDDGSPANGSSIAFILELGGRKILFSGDAHADRLIDSLENMGASSGNPITLDVFKIPHHASKYNISKELLQLMKCDNYLVSSNGNYFKHPDEVAMARLIKYGTPDTIIRFNYTTKYTERWDNPNYKERYKYATKYPNAGEEGYIYWDLTEE